MHDWYVLMFERWLFKRFSSPFTESAYIIIVLVLYVIARSPGGTTVAAATIRCLQTFRRKCVRLTWKIMSKVRLLLTRLLLDVYMHL